MIILKPWDVVDYLDSEKRIHGYLEAVTTDGDPVVLAAARDDVAKAQLVIEGRSTPIANTGVPAPPR